MSYNGLDKYLLKIKELKLDKLSLEDKTKLYHRKDYEQLLNSLSLLIRNQAFKIAEFNKQNNSNIITYNVDDLYQEGIEAAWKAINKFNPNTSESITAYALISARNNMYQFAIKKHNRTKYEGIDNLELSKDEEETSYDIEEVHNNINLLTSDDKFLIKAYYFNEMTLEEIGKIKGCSYVAIHNKLKKIIDKMKSNLN